jgi:flagellar hook-associated protein 3 FlgL
MSMRVATFSMNQQMLDAALRTQSKLASQQLQESTGLVSTDYGGLGTSARKVINLQVSVSQSQSYSAAATSASGRATMMSSALSSMTDLITQFRAQLTQSSNNLASGTATLQETAKQILSEFSSQLNTQYEGRYVFAGSATDQKPVDISALTSTPSSPTTADTSYYGGNSDITSVRVANEQTIQYGVAADNPAFEKALRALNLVANATTLDSTTLDEATNLTLSSLDGVLGVQGKLSVDSAAMQRAIGNQTDYQDFAKSLGTNLNSVDVAALTAQMSAYDAQLQASYSAIAKLSSVNLFDYLK